MGKNTREKLIDTALKMFAEQGYQSSTIQQIVDRAGTNIAAVNYHFGDKASFYGEVVSHALRQSQSMEKANFEKNHTPEKQLRIFIKWFIHHVVGISEECSFLNLIQMQEMMNPSPLLDKVVEMFIRPNHMKLREVVSALLPKNATEDQIRHHCFSIIGQCMHYKFGRQVMTRLYTDIDFTEDYADALAEHITNVSLAGMRATHKNES